MRGAGTLCGAASREPCLRKARYCFGNPRQCLRCSAASSGIACSSFGWRGSPPSPLICNQMFLFLSFFFLFFWDWRRSRTNSYQTARLILAYSDSPARWSGGPCCPSPRQRLCLFAAIFPPLPLLRFLFYLLLPAEKCNCASLRFLPILSKTSHADGRQGSESRTRHPGH